MFKVGQIVKMNAHGIEILSGLNIHLEGQARVLRVKPHEIKNTFVVNVTSNGKDYSFHSSYLEVVNKPNYVVKVASNRPEEE